MAVFPQHLLGAANVVHISKYGGSMTKESAQKGHFYVLQLNSHRITLTSIAGLVHVNDLDLTTQILVSPCHTCSVYAINSHIV